MNYKNIHDRIITQAKSAGRKRSKHAYYELHHVIPQCLGGDNSKDNLVLLTFKEHFIIHWLLCKIYKNDVKAMYKLSTAFVRMCSVNEFQQRTISARKYKIAKTIERKAKQGIAVGGALILNRSEEWKQNISTALRGGTRIIKGKRYADIYKPEILDRVMASRRVTKNKGMVWVNNGIDTCRVVPAEELPKGWVYGRLKWASAKQWYNNGATEKLLPINSDLIKQDTWKKGRINAKYKTNT